MNLPHSAKSPHRAMNAKNHNDATGEESQFD